MSLTNFCLSFYVKQRWAYFTCVYSLSFLSLCSSSFPFTSFSSLLFSHLFFSIFSSCPLHSLITSFPVSFSHILPCSLCFARLFCLSLSILDPSVLFLFCSLLSHHLLLSSPVLSSKSAIKSRCRVCGIYLINKCEHS